MKNSIFTIVSFFILFFSSCQKMKDVNNVPNREYPPRTTNHPKIMSDTLDFKCYIKDAVADFPDSTRSQMFIDTISRNDSRFNHSNTSEVVVEIYTTGESTIGYLNKDLQVPPSELPKPLQAMEGKGYYAYVLFDDGWFYYCYILVAADGTAVCEKQPYNDGTSTGFEPFWSGLDMNNVCFYYSKFNNKNGIFRI